MLINKEKAKAWKLKVNKIPEVRLSYANNTENFTNESTIATIKIGDFTINCELLLADIHHEIILGTPFWAKVKFQEIDWANQKIVLNKIDKPNIKYEWNFEESSNGTQSLQVSGIYSGEEQSLFKSNSVETERIENIEELIPINENIPEELPKHSDPGILKIINKYHQVFKTPQGIPPNRPDVVE